MPFSPDTTIAVILGASRWPYASKLPASNAFKQAAFGLIEYLTDPALLGLPNDDHHLLNLFNDDSSPYEMNRRLTVWLRQAQLRAKEREAPIRDFILYYVGHGGFTPGGEQAYYLAITSTEVGNEGISSLRMTDLARTIKREAALLRRFLILDCCFAESAYGLFQSEGGDPADAAHVKSLIEFSGPGTALLCSSSARDVSLAPKGEEYTMFTGCLLDVLHEGDPRISSALSFKQVGICVARRINEKYQDIQVRPKVSAPDEAEGRIADFPLFPNPSYRETQSIQIDSTSEGLAGPTPRLKPWAVGIGAKVATSTVWIVAVLVVLGAAVGSGFWLVLRHTDKPLISGTETVNSRSNPSLAQMPPMPNLAKSNIVVSLAKCQFVSEQAQFSDKLCKFPRGALHFTAGMVISVDGAPEANLLVPGAGTEQTSYSYPTPPASRPLNSEEVPYIVLPRRFLRTFNVRLGDMCVVTYDGNTAYAIVGDIGADHNDEPLRGEGSIALARRIGFEPIADGHRLQSISGGVGYTIFPGTSRADLNPVDARDQISQSGRQLWRTLSEQQ